MIILLFKGLRVPDKRYKNFIQTLKNKRARVIITDRYSPCIDVGNETIVVVAHSIGVCVSLLWLHENKITPQCIVALDGKYETHEIECQGSCEFVSNIYADCVERKLDHLLDLTISYRQENYIVETGVNPHYPFESRSVLGRILHSIFGDSEKKAVDTKLYESSKKR